jgi:hypothetical protein
MQGANDRTLMALGGWKSPAMLARYAHLSPTHLYQAVERLTQKGTVTKTVTTEADKHLEQYNLLEKVVSRLGLEPRALALKGLGALEDAASATTTSRKSRLIRPGKGLKLQTSASRT